MTTSHTSGIKTYNIPVQSIDKLLERLKCIYRRPLYDYNCTIHEIMYKEGQQDVINFIHKWIQDERNST